MSEGSEGSEGGPDFGRYQLVRRVSLGGTAEVFKAKAFGELGFEKIVALKRLLPHVEERPEFVRMFVNEARLVAQLDHPLIARIHELGRARGSHYLAMEYVYGRDLQEVQRQIALLADGGGAPADFTAAVGAQAAEALDYAHRFVDADGVALRIVHRDVSPQNLMIDEDGAVKLVDFGIAKFVGVDGVTAAGVVKGKHAYMSPEQVRREPLDGRSDLFSLGVILYELLSGERLFKAGTVLETLEMVEAAAPPDLVVAAPGTPPELARWVMCCLARERDARPPDGATLAAGLAAELARMACADPRVPVRRLYRAVCGDAPVEDAVTHEEYLEALRAAELGEDPALAARSASDITIVPDTDDLAAYVARLRHHMAAKKTPDDHGAGP